MPSTRPSNVSAWPSLGQAIASAQTKWAAGAASGSVASASRQTFSIARIQSRLPSSSSAQRAEKMPGRPWSASTHRPLSSASAGRPREVGRLARLQIGIVGEGVADLLGLGQAELLGADAGDAERLDQRGDLAQLARIVGRDDQLVADRPHRPVAFSCAAKISDAADAGEAEQPQQAFLVEAFAFGGQLRLDDRAVGGQHEIAVAAGGAESSS